jgi:NADH-quinone oxidoreductase subunit N
MSALIILFVGAIITLFTGVYGKRNALPWLAGLTLSGGLGATIYDFFQPEIKGFTGMLSFDRYSMVFTASILLVSLLIVVLSKYSFRKLKENLGDHYGLMLFSLCGAICMVSYEHLVMLFLGIEILSIPLYVLAGSKKKDPASNEAALKYFIMGAFATSVLLLGIVLVYGASGSFSLEGIGLYLLNHPAEVPAFFKVGVLLMMIGLCFKVGAAPFHFWTPDVYQGSPTTITLFMATAVKTSAFAAFFLLFNRIFSIVPDTWVISLVVISGTTMLLGNIMAVRQTDLKRIMAYSSISHAGFMLMAVISLRNGAASVLWMYTLAYSLASVAAFSVLILAQEQKGSTALAAFKGLGKWHPVMGAVVAVSLLSMAGIPPTGGFFAKYFLFILNIQANLGLVIVAIIASAISVYYYLRVIGVYFFEQPEEGDTALMVPVSYRVVHAISVLGIFLVAIFAERALALLLF